MQYFGHKVINPFRSHTPRGFYDAKKGHTGLDLDFAVGTPISLPIETTCFRFLVQKQMGNTLYLKDSEGNVLVFAHLSEVFVKSGDEIKPNQMFAKTGNTGSATTGAHLHFEVISQEPEKGLEFMTRSLGAITGYNIDPTAYLDSLTKKSDDKLEWMKEHELIFGDHKPTDKITWGELSLVLYRLVKKVLEWARTPNKSL